MRTAFFALTAAALIAGSAVAADVAVPKAGSMIVTSDGKRIGQIDRIVTDRSGQPLSASVIYDSRFVYVPVSTLTVDANGRATTSLSRKELTALR